MMNDRNFRLGAAHQPTASDYAHGASRRGRASPRCCCACIGPHIFGHDATRDDQLTAAADLDALPDSQNPIDGPVSGLQPTFLIVLRTEGTRQERPSLNKVQTRRFDPPRSWSGAPANPE
jgi:hypothetical protein